YGAQLVDLIAETFGHANKDREPPLPFQYIGGLVASDRNLDCLKHVGNVESVSRNLVAIQHDFEMFFAGHLLDRKILDASNTGHRAPDFLGQSSQDLSILSEHLHGNLSVDTRDQLVVPSLYDLREIETHSREALDSTTHRIDQIILGAGCSPLLLGLQADVEFVVADTFRIAAEFGSPDLCDYGFDLGELLEGALDLCGHVDCAIERDACRHRRP